MLQLPCRSRRADRRMQPARALMQLPERILEQLPAQLPSRSATSVGFVGSFPMKQAKS